MKKVVILSILLALIFSIKAYAYPIESDSKHALEQCKKSLKDKYGNELDPENTWGKTNWTGPKLTQKIGIIKGYNGGYVTYYHQPMGGCFRLHAEELAPYTQDDCWVSKDGVLYCGPYVCCAAYTPWYPPGTIVDTPFGKGLVVDYNGRCDLPNGTKADLDICTKWGKEVPN